MFKVLKNNDGFSGLIGLLIAIVVIGIMSAMILPTFTARMNYKQAQYVAGVTQTIENAENAYMAKNGSFADLVMLSQNGYLSPQFLQSLQPANNPGGPYPQPNWITFELAKHTVNLCIDNNGGCPDNPSGNNYFIGLYSVPGNYANYIEHELPGSGIGSQGGGLEYVAYAAPVPSAPPVAPSSLIGQNISGTNTTGYNLIVSQRVDESVYNNCGGSWQQSYDSIVSNIVLVPINGSIPQSVKNQIGFTGSANCTVWYVYGNENLGGSSTIIGIYN